MFAQTIFGLPEAPTALFVLTLVIVIGYLLLRSYSSSLRSEIDGLRTAMKQQSDRHRVEIHDLNEKVDRLENDYLEQRGMKHKAYNDVARCVMALDLVKRLAQDCKCGVLAPLQQVIDGLVHELENMPQRRQP